VPADLKETQMFKTDTCKMTSKGWTLTTTHRAHGALEQGGVVGRVEMVTFDQLIKLGIDPSTGPDGRHNDGMTNEDRVRAAIKDGMPTRVIRRGTIIR
jgi:hypothetical protein